MSVRTCTVMCPCGPNGEMLRCGYKPGHKGAHSWATLPTFIRPPDQPVEIQRAKTALTGMLTHHGVAVIATPEWWSAACSSLGEDYPHVSTIRKALASFTDSDPASEPRDE